MTKYVHRRADKTIQSIHGDPMKDYAEEALADDHPEILAFLAAHYPPPGYRELRKRDYVAEMGKEPSADPLDAIGDVLDEILGQLEALQGGGVALTPAVETLLAKRAAIKARHPKAA